jgi:hypothetical protein
MRRPRHATVVSYLALFVALGGTSYAALNVTGRDVEDGSLTGRDLRDRSVRGRDVRPQTLTSRHIRDGSLRPADFPGGVVPTGPAGATGPKGDTGPRGLKGEKGDKGDPGEPPATAFALVAGDGSLIADRGVETSSLETNAQGGPVYSLGFADDLKRCAIDVTVVDTAQATLYSQVPPAGTGSAVFLADHVVPVAFDNVDSGIMVRIYDAAGTAVQSPFQVAVMC